MRTALVAAFAVVVATGALAGCFYVDPINQRPSLDIRQREPTIRRGDRDVTLDAVFDDPEGHVVAFSWRVYACENGLDFATCDRLPLATSILETVTFDVPAFRIDPDGSGPSEAPPTRQILVILEGVDELGATARPAQQLVIPVANALPRVRTIEVTDYDRLVGTPIDVYAEYGDPDDGPGRVTLTWKAFSPQLTEFTLEEAPDRGQPTDPALRLAGKRLRPTVTGKWQIEVTATDVVGDVKTVLHETIVVPDTPPCIAQFAPLAPPPPAVLPLTEPTLFQVPLVTDALDRYPTIVGDPLLGTARFAWSLRRGGGPREVQVGATGNLLAVDPASYALGELLEVRVEVFDRNNNPIVCADADPTCSIVATSCIQRLTWLVEAR
ncbi:MAG: hypothetical protein KIT31_36395 [Deltaproteobacteria bacterium]|nr:hypothetical protein [Deltaproteobacteria bacterium]